MRINHNHDFMFAWRMNQQNNKLLSKSLQKLSSGLRINSAADDAAGLAISEKMRARIRGLQQSSRNIQDIISLVQTAEGGMQEIHSLLQRGRELSVQAANGTYTDADKKMIQEEIEQIKKEVDRIANNTEFNGINLLNRGRTSSDKDLKAEDGISHLLQSALENRNINLERKSELRTQLGAGQGESMTIPLPTVDSKTLSISDINVLIDAKDGIEKFEQAIQQLSSNRSELGAIQNRLEHAFSLNENYKQNLIESESRIRDTDMAKEIMNYTKYQILAQVSLAMMAQANKKPNIVLQLLS